MPHTPHTHTQQPPKHTTQKNNRQKPTETSCTTRWQSENIDVAAKLFIIKTFTKYSSPPGPSHHASTTSLSSISHKFPGSPHYLVARRPLPGPCCSHDATMRYHRPLTGCQGTASPNSDPSLQLAAAGYVQLAPAALHVVSSGPVQPLALFGLRLQEHGFRIPWVQSHCAAIFSSTTNF